MLFEKKSGGDFEQKTVLIEIQVDQIVIDQVEITLNSYIGKGEVSESLVLPITYAKINIKVQIGDNVPINNDLVTNLELQNQELIKEVKSLKHKL